LPRNAGSCSWRQSKRQVSRLGLPDWPPSVA
jgi:hypothetical protein